MNGSQLEAWAVRKAAQNNNPHPNHKPVVLYKNNAAEGMGAILSSKGSSLVLTAGHLFWRNAPACRWTCRVLKPESDLHLPITNVGPLQADSTADVAMCTFGTILQTSPLLENFFYQGPRWSGGMDVRLHERGGRTLTSTISGERLKSAGEVTYDSAPYEALDYVCMPGESGTILWDEQDEGRIFILKGDSPEMAKYLRPKGLCKSGKIALALRLYMK